MTWLGDACVILKIELEILQASDRIQLAILLGCERSLLRSFAWVKPD